MERSSAKLAPWMMLGAAVGTVWMISSSHPLPQASHPMALSDFKFSSTGSQHDVNWQQRPTFSFTAGVPNRNVATSCHQLYQGPQHSSVHSYREEIYHLRGKGLRSIYFKRERKTVQTRLVQMLLIPEYDHIRLDGAGCFLGPQFCQEFNAVNQVFIQEICYYTQRL